MLMDVPVVLEPFVENSVFSPLHCLALFVKNQLSIEVWVYLWALFCLLIYLSLCQYHGILITIVL